MHIISEPGCQLFKMVALFPVGRVSESKRGLTQSVTAMMKKATLARSSKKLHEYLDRYSIQIEVYSTPTHITAQLHCQAKFIDKSIPVFFEILFQSKFLKNHWEIVRHQVIDNIKQQEKQTDFWADKLLSEHLFGWNHPYGYYSQPSDYLNIQIDQIQDFYATHIQIQKPEFFLAGDDILIAQKIINSEVKKYPLQKNQKKPRVRLVHTSPSIMEKKLEGSSQASVRLGKIFQRKSFKDFQTLELMTVFLGGYYMSALMKLLRVEMGITYGVYAHLNHFFDVSVLHIGFETDMKNVPESLKAISELFERLSKEQRLKIGEAAKEYYSQWSKNSEKSLQEIMYKVRMFKLGYNYTEYCQWINLLEGIPKSKSISIDPNIFDINTYSKSVVY